MEPILFVVTSYNGWVFLLSANMETKTLHPSVLKILYLDDNEVDIQHFKFKLKRYANQLKERESEITFDIYATTSHFEFYQCAETREYNCLLVDHNMTEVKGLELLKGLTEFQSGSCFALYTGAGSIDPMISDICEQYQFLLLDKLADFNETIDRILTKLRIEIPESPLYQVYSHVTEDLLIDLENLKRLDPQFTIRHCLKKCVSV